MTAKEANFAPGGLAEADLSLGPDVSALAAKRDISALSLLINGSVCPQESDMTVSQKTSSEGDPVQAEPDQFFVLTWHLVNRTDRTG